MLELSESKSEGRKRSVPTWLGQGCSFPALPFWSWLSLGCSGRVNSPWKGLFFLSRAGGCGLSWLSAFPHTHSCQYPLDLCPLDPHQSTQPSQE